jgi:hypothetical protein
VVPAVSEQDGRCATPEIAERIEERLSKVGARRRAPTVQEHKQLAVPTTSSRNDKDLVQVPMSERAVQSETHDARAARTRIATPPIAKPEVTRADDEREEAEN